MLTKIGIGPLISCFLTIQADCGPSIKDHQDPPIVVQDAPVDSVILPGIFQTDLYLDLIKNKKIGAVCNIASVAGDVNLVDTLLSLGVDLQYVIVPEHGFRASENRGQIIEDEFDPETGIPIISMYKGKENFPMELLDSIDVLVFDLQDVGARFFTYINALLISMEACAARHVPMIVLDRPNPNGYYIDGPMLKKGFYSGVGMIQVPVVYGMTMGELGLMINGEGWLRNTSDTCNLSVIPCKGYDHTTTYAPGERPSPNLPNLRSILLYPSLCFFEGTTVSVGRGTNDQFQIIGHPKIVTGSYIFTPESKPGATHPLHEGTPCYGWSLKDLSIEMIMEKRQLDLHWLIAFYQALKEKDRFFLENHFFDKLAGTDQLRLDILAGKTEQQIRESWQEDLEAFKKLRTKYLLYEDF